jgi:hypothetical protein
MYGTIIVVFSDPDPALPLIPDPGSDPVPDPDRFRKIHLNCRPANHLNIAKRADF